MSKSLGLYLALILSGFPIAAEELSAGLDPAQTEINWTLGDVLHTVHGTFQLKRGQLRFDPSTGMAAGEIVVDVASGQSGNGARDRRMHKDILESQKFPEAIFTADAVQGQLAPTGVSRFAFHGALSIHGASHEITVPASLERTGDGLIATVHFVIPYVKWGMKNPSNFLLRVSDHVDMDVKTKVPAHASTY